MMTYDQAIAFIHGAYGQGEKHGLDNMHRLLALLGNPHHSFAAIHVAGTNGKGSTCTFLQAILRCAGYRTGLYTSPFLQRYNERMRVDGVPIADDTLAALMARVAQAVQALRAEGVRPTEFEIGTSLAFLYFYQARVDVAVVEVGLGGRLDPTNVLSPVACAIAAIGLDHTRVLGDTIEAIALEKAGIAKPGIPLILSAQNPASVRSVVQAHCARMNTPFSMAGPAEGLPLGLPGGHQAYNAGLAVAMAALLREAGWHIADAAIADGLRRARWPGRLEWFEGTPPILMDGAHNGQGAQALATYLRALPRARVVLLCGVLQDKDYAAIVAPLAGVADAVVCVRPDSHRALDADMLAAAFAARGTTAHAAPSLAEALAMSRALATGEGRVVIAGSLYLVGEARTLVHGMEDALLSQA